MSELSNQCDELRTLADKLRSARFYDQANYTENIETLYRTMGAMREAADTIESLQGEANHWKVEQVHAYSNWEDAHSRVKELEADNGTRWHELFGTPERAAEYFAMQCFGSDGGLCYYCPFDDCDEGLRNMGAYPSVRSKMLEWLRGDA